MRPLHIKLPELALIAGTRGMIGFGAGLLAAEHLRSTRRQRVGVTLLAAGILSTIPIAIVLLRRRRRARVRTTVGIDAHRFDEPAAAVMAD